jgi:HrpA-like RNA helicase
LNDVLQGFRISHSLFLQVHERSLDSDILLALLKRKLQSEKQSNLRVILMSATIDADRFTTYWDGGETPRIHIPGRTFPVQDFMLEDVLALSQYIPPKRKKSNGGRQNLIDHWEEERDEEAIDADDNEIEDETIGGHSIADLVKRVDETSIDYNLLAQLVRTLIINKDPSDDGSILVFLPGAPEIDRALETVRKVTRGLSVQLFPLHGGLQPKEQNRVFQPASAGFYKVIFSTNVAETYVSRIFLCLV